MWELNRPTHNPEDVTVEDVTDVLDIEALSRCIDCESNPCICPYCMVCGKDWEDCQDWIRP